MSKAMKTMISVYFAFCAMLSANGAAADGLRDVRQTIFGMDCAPCAYGVEKGLRALPGVGNVSVSLNEGYARASLEADSPTTLAQIRETIRNNGFTPKEATVQVEGSFSSSPTPTLHAGEQVYQLHFDAFPPEVAADRDVVVTGNVAADADSGIEVTRIELLSPAS